MKQNHAILKYMINFNNKINNSNKLMIIKKNYIKLFSMLIEIIIILNQDRKINNKRFLK